LDPLLPETLEEIERHPKIFTTGFQQDVRPYFNISDVLAFPSYREGFPNVVMQAGAMELPCIVSDINGCNEIVTEGYTGVIIPAKDEKELFKAMKLMAEKPDHRLELKENSREQICQYYERKEFWGVLLREYKKLESEILKS
ncbi:MAG: glycosyltransferase, partial [Salegentibacter sp.]